VAGGDRAPTPSEAGQDRPMDAVEQPVEDGCFLATVAGIPVQDASSNGIRWRLVTAHLEADDTRRR